MSEHLFGIAAIALGFLFAFFFFLAKESSSI